MTIIEHGSDSIKTETIKMILLEPIFTIGKQEMNHIIFAIIKAEAVPCRMFVSVTWIEILIGITG